MSDDRPVVTLKDFLKRNDVLFGSGLVVFLWILTLLLNGSLLNDIPKVYMLYSVLTCQTWMILYFMAWTYAFSPVSDITLKWFRHGDVGLLSFCLVIFHLIRISMIVWHMTIFGTHDSWQSKWMDALLVIDNLFFMILVILEFYYRYGAFQLLGAKKSSEYSREPLPDNESLVIDDEE